MSNITKANVNQYRTDHECDEHWELRRKFLLTHSDKFSVDEIMCLAQVFTNVEFLGCKYSKETMQMISELSKDVVGDYRSKQENRLQRTLVGASDAVSSKVKNVQSEIDNLDKECLLIQETLENLRNEISNNTIQISKHNLKKTNPPELVNEPKEFGGFTEKYQLIEITY